MKLIRSAVLASAAMALALPAMAYAQSADEGAAAGDIIVTAQKREENLQSVPVAISVISGAALANNGGLTLENAQYLVPSMNFRKAGTTLNQALFLRGVGTINFSIAAEPSVAAVLDGVVLSRAGEGFSDLFDVERVEVLRGPQGTLFGKNASAGVVSIVTKRPTDKLESTVEASYFDKSEYRARATINAPLSEKVRSRITGFYGQYDGNIYNIAAKTKVNGYKRYGLRGVIEADASETLTLTLRADYRKANDDCCGEIISPRPTNAAALALTGTTFDGVEARTVNQNLVTATKEKSWGTSLQADLELGDHTLTSITSYRGWDNREIRDGDWLSQPYVGLNQLHDNGPQTSNTFTQEVRIASPTGGLIEYVVGAYYSRAKSERTFTRNVIACSASTLAEIAAGLRPCSTDPAVSTFTNPIGSATFGSTFDNKALFGQTTINVSSAFRLIGGLRYTKDDLDVFLGRTSNFPDARPGIRPNFNFAGGTSKSNVSGKAGFQADVTEDTMVYGSYTRGYKGPAYNVFFNMYKSANPPLAGLVGIDDTNVIAAETVDAFEVGAKNSLFDGRAIINVAAYYAKYYNYQANNPDLVAGVVTTRLTNAGTVSTKGFEVDAILRPARNVNISGGFAYNDAQVVAFRLPAGGNPANIVAPGTPLPNAPKYKASVGADWTIETGNSFNVQLGTSLAYQSSQIYELTANLTTRAGTTVAGYSIVDVNASLVDVNDRWKITAHVKNLFDKSFASSIISGGPGGSFRYIIPREADRYVGITAQLNFGN
ncbi:MAG: TonB-dependent receptor [Sphingomonadaceae bacterium]|jgi:iron complex outermembrane recepter protein|nr:TonB-dependent receptor [Sphingomonadaceae bacterium]NCA00925.1 TonB-dependent receptor [Sphingomonadaceae bacterium]